MRTSEVGLGLIREFEKFEPKPYLCPAGVPTIGWGCTFYEDGTRVTMNDPQISTDRAERLFKHVVEGFERQLSAALEAEVTQNEWDALMSFLYNVGPGVKGVKDGLITLKSGQPSTLLRCVNAREAEAAGSQFLLWNKSRGVVMNGLTRRRKQERRLYLGHD